MTAGGDPSRPELEAWVAEFVHASPEHFDEAMLHNLAEQGLLQAGALTQQSGRIADIDLLDLLQSLGIYRRAGHVLFFHPHGVSQLWFEDGHIVDAHSGALRGAEAIHRIVMHDDGDFRVEVTGQSRPRVIEGSVSALVLEAASQLDEVRRLLPQLPATDVVLRLRPGTKDREVPAALAERLAEGTTIDEVLERSPLSPVATLQHIARLIDFDGLVRTGEIREPEIPSIQRRATALRTVVQETSQPYLPVIGGAPRPRRSRRRAMEWGMAAGLLLTAVFLAWWKGGDETRAPEPAMTVAPGSAPLAMANPVAPPTTPAAPTIAAKPSVAPLPPVAVADPGPADLGASEAIELDEPARATAPEADAEPSPAPPRRKSSRSRRSAPSPTVDATPAPASKPAPTKPKDAATLLAEARSAYNSGRGTAAYKLASESLRMRATPEAAEILTLSACQMNAPDKAERALRLVPLLRRNAVRGTCKKRHSVKI